MSRIETSAALDWAHPLVRDWFLSRFGSPTEPQEQGWPQILQGNATLISAPTGSGKTFSAFLICIDKLVRKALDGSLSNTTEVVYVSPLKALSNDIQKNLEAPLAEICELAKTRGLDMKLIRTAVRTGDTLAAERRSILKTPPHILVTTPESLYILLTAEKSRANLRGVETVIVDEIHALADDKRGTHLSLSLERLDFTAKKTPLRIGLSATQKPIETVARFLVGNSKTLPSIVDVGHKREIDFAVEVPAMPLGAVSSNEQWEETYDRLADLVGQHRSTLIFVNTRRLAERLCLHLSERVGEDAVAAHHGSLSRKLRHQAEQKLKSGQLRALVATASLELGIDIGTIDLVCLVSSPRSISVALQRIGRAGHWRGAVPKGRIFPTTRDELLECAALVKAVKEGDLDRLIMPKCPLDILAQQIVAMCSCDDWGEDELYETVCKAAPYGELSRAEFNRVIEMLADGISASRGRIGAYLLWNRVDRILKGRRGARLAAITSGGAIPETALYNVVAQPEETVVGTIDEDFAIDSMKGDVFLLGNSSWRIRRVESARGRVLVEDARGASPTIPFWFGEAPARSEELSAQLASLREKISVSLPVPDTAACISEAKNPRVIELTQLLKDEYGLDNSGAEQAIEYVLEGRAVLGAVPTKDRIIAERFFDEGGGMQLIIHSPFGARINKAWGLALRKCFCRSFNFELQASATDNGLNISLAEQHSFPLADVFNFLSPASVKHVLEQAALASPIFNTRFRWDATRSLALLRFQGGKKVPPYLQRMKSDDLLAAVFPDAAACQDNIAGDRELPDHPLVNEVMKDVLTEAMDLDGLTSLLERIHSGEIRCVTVDTPVPSAFSHEILNANPYAFLDDAPLEERRARAVELRRVLPDSMKDMAQLDPHALAQVLEEACPDLRDADELHDFLQTVVVMPEDLPLGKNSQWEPYFEELAGGKRAAKASVKNKIFWISAERKSHFEKLYAEQSYLNALAQISSCDLSREDALMQLLKGWLSYLGPISAPELAELFGLDQREIEICLLRLEASGAILQGRFRNLPAQDNRLEWCERRLLARIHKLTVATLRKGIEPVSPAQYMNWLLQWQHLAAGSQLVCDERSTLEVIGQLQAYEIPANAWESQILSKRLKDYNPEILDRLCLKGAIGWGRLSPHPATQVVQVNQSSELPEGGIRSWRVIPSSVAPIAFFVRADSDWMAAKNSEELFPENRGLSSQAVDVMDYLKLRGASFFDDIVRATKRLPAEIENALWELVAAGIATADGFDNLRALIDPKRRAGQGRARNRRPRHSTGRWSIMHSEQLERNLQLESICRVLLRRYGVVFRDVLLRESLIPRWRELLMTFRRLEDRGEIRGGRFVSGFIGEQFALPEAVESLRASRNRTLPSELLVLSGADPLNLIGSIIPGKKTPATSSNTIILKDGAEFLPPVKATNMPA